MEEIIEDFKSLEDLAKSLEVIETTSSDNEETHNTKECEKIKDYNLQLQDFRRPKLQEYQSNNKYKKLNRSYSLKEMREHGLQVLSVTDSASQQKIINHPLILSEFIL